MTRMTKENPDYGLYCEVISYPSTSSFFELDIRLLSIYKPISSPTIKATTTPKNGKSKSMVLKVYSVQYPDPWLWRWYYKENLSSPFIEPGDTVHMTIDASNEKGIYVFEIDCNLNPSSAEKIKEPNPPRLICAINSTPVRKTNDEGSPDASTIERILKHIWKRLNRPMDDAWWGPYGDDQGLVSLDKLDKEFGFPGRRTKEEIENEKWAREFSEMLLCVPYVSFAPAYQYGPDDMFYKKMEGKKGDRAYPLVAACQHLATMAVSTRGINLGSSLNAGFQSADVVGKSNWFENEIKVEGLIGAKQDSDSSINPGKKPDLQPGSFFLFAKNKKGQGKSNVSGDHIAPILRIKKSPLGNKLQLFDTSAMGCREIADLDIVPGTPGQYDDPWAKEIKGPIWFQKREAPDPLFGCGAVSAPENLNDAIKNMEASVPIGLVRLVLLYEEKILFATPLLDMHTRTMVIPDDYTMDYRTRFSIARLLWSLRELPGRGSIEAQWLIDIPRGKLAKRFLEEHSLHTTPLSELVDGLNFKKGGTDLRLPLIDLSSAPDGKVKILRYFNFDEKITKMVPSIRQKILDHLPPDKHVVKKDVLTLTEEFFDEKRENDNGQIITFSYFKGRWPFPQAVTPQIAPLEGKMRIRIEGTKFSENSTVLIGNSTASEVLVSQRGEYLYATTPSGTEGYADIKISTTGQLDKVISPGIRYVSDVIDAAKAVLESTIVHLEELQERAEEMRDTGTLTYLECSKLQVELELAMEFSYEAVDQRILVVGSADYTALGEVYYSYLDLQHQIYQDIKGIIG